MKQTLLFFAITSIIFASCGEKKEATSENKETPDTSEQASSDFKKLSYKATPLDFATVCKTDSIEYIDLYPRIHSIAIDSTEKLILVQQLKENGFTVEHWGRGNFMQGPRMVSITMKKDDCTLRVDKLYYDTDTVGTFRVTERILKL